MLELRVAVRSPLRRRENLGATRSAAPASRPREEIRARCCRSWPWPRRFSRRAAIFGDVLLLYGARQQQCRSQQLTADPISTPNTGTSCCAESTEKRQNSYESAAPSGRPRDWRPPGRRSLAPRRLPTRSSSARRSCASRSPAKFDSPTNSLAATFWCSGRTAARPNELSCASAVSSTSARTGSPSAWERRGPTGSGRRAVDPGRLESSRARSTAGAAARAAGGA